LALAGIPLPARAPFKEYKMDFPRSVFTSPGSQKGGGYSFDYELVENEAELADALASGVWFESVPEAVSAFETGVTPKAKKKAKE
jgi:hypothetical protein